MRGPTGAVAPRLDKGTFLARSRLLLRVKRYGDGGGKACASYEPITRPAGQPVDRTTLTAEQVARLDSVNVQRAARRARQAVIELCRVNRLRYMYTLTFAGAGVHDYLEACAHLEAFIHRGGGGALFHGLYLAVPELHPGGHGWHWHVLTGHRVWVTDLRKAWTDFMRSRGMEPSGGSKYLQVEATGCESGQAAGLYAAKYISKTFADGTVPAGSHRYRDGEGLKRAQVEVYVIGGFDQIIPWVVSEEGVEPQFVSRSETWESYGGPPVWVVYW